MISRRLATKVMVGAFLLALMVPAMAFAAETTGDAGPWQAQVGAAIAAGFAMGISALAAGYAQAKIGSAGAGTLAERPEAAIWIITLQALPEVIVLLGFVSAIIIAG